MIKKQLTLTNKLGLHARAAMKLVNAASTFTSEIIVYYKNYQVNAKSLLNVMALGAPCGAELSLEISGEDEVAAMQKLSDLIIDKFGEEK